MQVSLPDYEAGILLNLSISFPNNLITMIFLILRSSKKKKKKKSQKSEKSLFTILNALQCRGPGKQRIVVKKYLKSCDNMLICKQ